ncbi:hypothetical protein HK099_000905 [Clydaea vesicula]|uniref:Alpha-type protein kinase domain-containing protein n=1 Tax=Clydaea vesicula TaxID=447962 RepID=A0AAD5U454_9FUNG|nr:hypothetical protein HK099_000905 [Clydaea vesicula]
MPGANELDNIQNQINSLDLQFLLPKQTPKLSQNHSINVLPNINSSTSLAPPERSSSYITKIRCSSVPPPARTSSIPLPRSNTVNTYNSFSSVDTAYSFSENNDHNDYRMSRSPNRSFFEHNFSSNASGTPQPYPRQSRVSSTSFGPTNCSLRKLHHMDVAFLFNLSGNVQELFDELKFSIPLLTNKFTLKYPDGNLRLAFVGYSEFGAGCASYYEIQDFCSPAEFFVFLNEIVQLRLGSREKFGDIIGGLRSSLKLNWKGKSRSLILLTNRPGYGVEYNSFCSMEAWNSKSKMFSFSKGKSKINRMLNKNYDIEKAQQRAEKVDKFCAKNEQILLQNIALKNENEQLAKKLSAKVYYNKCFTEPRLKLEEVRLNKLKALRAVQLEALMEMDIQTSNEDALLLRGVTEEQTIKTVEENHSLYETSWILDILELKPLIKQFSTEANKVYPEYKKVLANRKSIELTLEEVSRKAERAISAFKNFEARSVNLLKTLKLIIELLQKYLVNIQKKSAMEQMAQNGEIVELDRLRPYEEENFKWPSRIVINAVQFRIPDDQQVPVSPNKIIPNLIEYRKKMDLQIMDKPYAKGTFRCAYYALDLLTNKKYTVKHFHVLRNARADLNDCIKVSKAYSFAKYCGLIFQNELFKRQKTLYTEWGGSADLLEHHSFDIHSFNYIDSYFAEVTPWFNSLNGIPYSENTGIMIEPLMPDFFKWFNNDMQYRYVGEEEKYPHHSVLAAFIHWTYHTSGRSFIIADLQGMKLAIPLNVAGEDVDVIVAQNLASFSELEKTRGEIVVKWVLSDPVIHVLKGSGGDEATAAQISQAITYDFDGNLGLQAENLFYSKHTCGDICGLLELPPINF